MSKKNYPLLYAAYGANTHRDHMAHRCPTAKYVGNAVLADYRLIFRSVADVIPVRGQSTVVALWEILPNDERALDRFEGYPTHYTKHYAKIKVKGRTRLMMFYIMAGDRRDRHEPPRSYEQTLREGYQHCGMDPTQIDAAVRDAKNSERRAQRYSGKWLAADERKPLLPRTAYERVMYGTTPKPEPREPRARGVRMDQREFWTDDDLDGRFENEQARMDRLREIFPEYPDWFLKETGYFKAFE